MKATNATEITLLNIETNNSKVFELIDDRLIDYSDIYVENSLFMNHEPRDTIIFNNNEFIAFSIDFATSVNAISDRRRRARNRNLLSADNDTIFSPTKMPLGINKTHVPTIASPSVHPTSSPVADGIVSQIYFSDFEFSEYYDTQNLGWSSNIPFYDGLLFDNETNHTNCDSALIVLLNGHLNSEDQIKVL